MDSPIVVETKQESSAAADGVDAAARLAKLREALQQGKDGINSYLQSRFPTVSSLDAVNEELELLQREIGNTETKISSMLHSYALTGQSTMDRLSELDTLRERLQSTYSQFSNAMDVCESNVGDFCNQLEVFDNAKSRLTQTIGALQRLSMLHDAIETLTGSWNKGDRRAAVDLALAITSLGEEFEQFENVSTSIEKELDAKKKLFALIFEQICQEYKGLYSVRGVAEPLKGYGRLAAAVKEDGDNFLRQQFIDNTLQNYARNFSNVHAALEQFPRRFAWFRRACRDYEGTYGEHFPEEWEVCYHLGLQFCSTTRHCLLGSLANSCLDVSAELVYELTRETIAFEVFLNERLDKETFTSRISSALDNYVGVWTNELENSLCKELHSKLQADTPIRTTVNAGWITNIIPVGSVLPPSLFSSATHLFDAMQRAGDKTALIKAKEKLRKICGSLLTLYCTYLIKTIEVSSDIKSAATCLGSAEYCSEMLEYMVSDETRELWEEHLDALWMRRQEAVAKIVSCLVAPVITIMKSELRNIGKSDKPVGGISGYLATIRSLVNEGFKDIKLMVSSHTVPHLLNKIVVAVSVQHFQYLISLEFLSSTGAQQLLLDVCALKKVCLSIDHPHAKSKIFETIVNQELDNAAVVLKLVSSECNSKESFNDMKSQLQSAYPQLTYDTIVSLTSSRIS